MSDYEYDVFISYRRTGNVRDWTHNHLEPRLRRCLADELPDEPSIFFDRDIDAGTPWPDHLVRALHRSRLLLAVWSPPYFTSRWCLAEWRTFLAREDAIRRSAPEISADHPPSLVYPIRYSDGDRFPADAKNVQQETIFSGWNYPDPQFAQTEKYLGFHDAVVQLARRIAQRLDEAPRWQPDWPTATPEPVVAGPAALPRF